MTDNDTTGNNDSNRVRLEARDLFDESAAPVEPNEAEIARRERKKARRDEVTRRADPLTGAIKAGRLADGDDWLGGPAPTPREALLEHPVDVDGGLFLPAGKAAMLVAPGGTGKTTVLMQLAISVATGLPWLKHYQVARKGRVLVALGEEDQAEMQRSLFYSARAAGIVPSDNDSNETREHKHQHRQAIYDNVVAYPLAGIPVAFVDRDGFEQPFFDRLHNFIEETGPYSLVILDPGSRFMGPEAETDNAAATRFVQCLESLTQTEGTPTVLMAHHTNKTALGAQESSQGDARGSSALVDGVRWVCNLRSAMQPFKGGGLRTTLQVTKTNYGKPGDPLELLRTDSGWRAMTDSEIIADIAERIKLEDEAITRETTRKTKARSEGRKDATKEVEDAF